MNPSKEYLKLKAGKQSNRVFTAKITPALAQEIIEKSTNRIDPTIAMTFAFLRLFKAYDHFGDFIKISYDSDELVDGAHRLAGFILSGQKSASFMFIFISSTPFIWYYYSANKRLP